MEPSVNQKSVNCYSLPAVPHAPDYWSELHGRESKEVCEVRVLANVHLVYGCSSI
jgi:hypothetical protein